MDKLNSIVQYNDHDIRSLRVTFAKLAYNRYDDLIRIRYNGDRSTSSFHHHSDFRAMREANNNFFVEFIYE